MLIPKSLADGTRSGHPVQFGHGLFGSRSQVEQSARERFADEYGYVLYALNWVGMAEDDPVTIADLVISGQMERFGQVPDRLSQALVNYVLATRMMKTNFVDDPNVMFAGKSAIDPAQVHYFGESQGGIMGCAYMGISTDIRRGGLRVGGQPYSLLLSRSVDFGIYFTAMKLAYDNPMDQHLLIGLAQMLWDRTEPNGLCAYVGSDKPLPGAEDNRVLLHVAIGDHEVTPLGGHVMARTVGARTIAPQTRKPVWH